MNDLRYGQLQFAHVGVVVSGIDLRGSRPPPPVTPAICACSFAVEEEVLEVIKRRRLKQEKDAKDKEAVAVKAESEQSAKKAALKEVKYAKAEIEHNTRTPDTITPVPIMVSPIRVQSSDVSSNAPIVQVQAVVVPEGNCDVSLERVNAITVEPSTVTVVKPKTENKREEDGAGELTGEQKKSVETFIGIVNYNDREKAIQFLQHCNWNISQAVEDYYSHGGDIDTVLVGNEHEGKVSSPKSPI
mmetsp:Transcript_17295/g.24210  ORF Transcript_17295/g.24210 Transcript_17295/m.24210 type:complete len:244 (+) Transcript_17295:118-849(+)|eukprot:CAMPEP_0184487510 /NCGR_PEP_ID=MMETSP0113_2-20130426/10159_1 /TAXON_ID=91329 /ORGANISM="Norrisiella sphaerica, Strain BC52" /LENGTH=243 /DNA_ID=CAMNT_0026869847 /DNA_START=118 /DNA_END=849 /DNA_ORIENTATION=-